MMEFLDTVMKLRGWGSGLRRAIADWYTRLGPDELAYQTLKYRNRNGWSHRDILRKAHIHNDAWNPKSRAMARWIVAGRAGLDERLVENRAGRRELQPIVGEPPALVAAFETIQSLPNDSRGLGMLCALIEQYQLPHELVPDHFKGTPEVWHALLQHMPPRALLRNLGKMSAIGLLTNGSDATAQVCRRLSSLEAIRKGRLHPMNFLLTQGIYAKGHGDKGKLTWTPASTIVEVLERSFYLAFGNVTPTNQRLWLCLDVSDSMTWDHTKVSGMRPMRLSAALALVTLKTEPLARVMAFSHQLVPFEIELATVNGMKAYSRKG